MKKKELSIMESLTRTITKKLYNQSFKDLVSWDNREDKYYNLYQRLGTEMYDKYFPIYNANSEITGQISTDEGLKELRHKTLIKLIEDLDGMGIITIV